MGLYSWQPRQRECPGHSRLTQSVQLTGWFCSSPFHFQLSPNPTPCPMPYPTVLSYTRQSLKIFHIHSFNTGGYAIKWKLIQINVKQMNSFLSLWILSFLAVPVLSPQTSWNPIIFRYCAIRQIWNPKPTPGVFIFLDRFHFPLNNIPALFLLAQLAWAKVCQEWKPELLLPMLDLNHTYCCLIIFFFFFTFFFWQNV